MSFYFYVETDKPFPTVDVLQYLRDPDIAWLEEEPGEKVFYKKGKSLRGVCVYANETGFEIGLNAFTSRDDALLARDICIAVAKFLGCRITPEDSEIGLDAEALEDACDDQWLAARYQEAFSVLRMIKDEPADQQMKIMGYRRGYAISGALVEGMREAGNTDEELVASLIQDGITIQEIDLTEDIFVPKILAITTDITTDQKGWFRAKKIQEKQSFVGFALPPGVRTLTPIFLSEGDEYAILGNEDQGLRRVPYARVKDYARREGAKEYGTGTFDLTVDGAHYDELFRSGQAMK